ncbi:hypothetical protein LOC54_10575 [Acetobacter sp. AN02]|uniref:tetratricopeptide repeat protein n=1 Tax=Acetobacter sp. AN02 TaxID=2894186 RepID=UPI0024342CC2|nr:hypothetical protein [Acetobacter sp. AN02]MDG6095537.1 hypothetical protein [Acetobacter sp. AN02]
MENCVRKELVVASFLKNLLTPENSLFALLDKACEGELPVEEAVRIFREFARRDNPRACRHLALAYLTGEGIESHPPSARRWMRHAAELGDGKAWNWLARICADGIPEAGTGVSLLGPWEPQEPDRALVMKSAQKGVAAGDPEAAVFLAWYLSSDPDTPETVQRDALRQAAGSGSPWVCTALAREALEAVMPEAAGGFTDRVGIVTYWLDQALEQDFPAAHYLTAVIAEDARFGHPDPAKAFLHLEKAAQGGECHAAFCLGRVLLYGTPAVAASPEHGVTWLRQAANADSEEAALTLGRWYAAAGEEQNLTEAIRWYCRAREKGSRDAVRELAGLVMRSGNGSFPAEDGMLWLREAAETGDREAWLQLLRCLAAGQGAEHLSWALDRLEREARLKAPGRPGKVADLLRRAHPHMEPA